jgi:cyclin B
MPARSAPQRGVRCEEVGCIVNKAGTIASSSFSCMCPENVPNQYSHRQGNGALSDITNMSTYREGTYGKRPSLGQVSGTSFERTVVMPQATTYSTAFHPTCYPPDTQSYVPIPAVFAPDSLSMFAATIDPREGECNQVQSVSEYATDIFKQLLKEEGTYLPRPNYMDGQTDINEKMRAILLDWLIEVHLKYHLRKETLFLTINLIDRFLSRVSVVRKKLQLVGVTAMFIAAKYEEITPPSLKDFVYITDNAYTKEQVTAMECTMLQTLDFKIVVPTAAHFFEWLKRSNNSDDFQSELAEYLIELGLLDMRMLFYPPSHIVSAAFVLSNELLHKRPLGPQFAEGSTYYTEHQLRLCVNDLRELLEAAPNNRQQAVRKKFLLPKYHEVAKICSR